MRVDGWCCFDTCCRLSLYISSTIHSQSRCSVPLALQFLHFQTKFASPLLPDISLFSCWKLVMLGIPSNGASALQHGKRVGRTRPQVTLVMQILEPSSVMKILEPYRIERQAQTQEAGILTNRDRLIQLGCVSRHDVHWTLNVYQ